MDTQQQDFYLPGLDGLNGALKVVLHQCQRQALQTVVTTQFQQNYIRFMLIQYLRNAAQAALGGFTADAGIEYRGVKIWRCQPFLQQLNPAFLLVNAKGSA